MLSCDLLLQLLPSQRGQLLPISAVFICPSWTPHPSSTPVRGHDPLIRPTTGLLALDQVLSFHTSIRLSLRLSIHPTALSVDASITSYLSRGRGDDSSAHLGLSGL